MNRRRVLGLAVVALAPSAGVHADMPPAEQALVDRLIEVVAQRTEIQFVRNGRAYSSDDAATFLREKLKSRSDKVANADDFIAVVATHSSMSGEPYRLRFPDGREMSSAQFLREQLARMRR